MMNADDLFNAGATIDTVPEGDASRQAVDSLRGYAYQILATALAWVDIDEHGRIFLEVAKDYATVVNRALRADQVKDTEKSGTVTLNSTSIRAAVAAFVDLVKRNPNLEVDLRFLTTSEIGTEHAVADRPAGAAGLEYWRKAAGRAERVDISPLRAILESCRFPQSVREFSRVRDDAELRRDLIGRIHWDCGKPNFATLRQQLEARLVVVGRDKFRLPASEARRVVDHIVYRVLKTSIINEPEDRVLTRDDLYSMIDAATRTSVPHAMVDVLARVVSDLAPSLSGGLAPGNSLSTTETGWIIEGAVLPVLQGMITRADVESSLADVLRDFCAVILVGGSGVGKSIVSRAVAGARCGDFVMVDLRNTDAEEICRRLDVVFARVGGQNALTLILEDLNHVDDTRVVVSLARVIDSSRRNYGEVLITCFRSPTLNTLAKLGLGQNCVVDCPYFSQKEARGLVCANGGDPDRWGHLAYIAGTFGHPQLTHAFVTGMAVREWPVEEIEDVISLVVSSEDVDATRDAARRNLVSALPEGTRKLLYRLSLTTGRFNRSLALTIGDISPAVSLPGERMDQLVGPWIEAAGRDLFRVSPLVSSSGHMTLALDEQRRIHETIAVQTLRKPAIDASEFFAIMTHAIAGKSPQSLVSLAQIVISEDSRTLEALAQHLSLFCYLRTDVPIYIEDPAASGMVRLAQFKLAVAAGDEDTAADVAIALFKEIAVIPRGKERRRLEEITLLIVLATAGVANYLEDWSARLRRLKAMVESNDHLQALVVNFERSVDAGGLFGMLFDVGSAGLASVERLERVINELDELEASERGAWLKPSNIEFSDYSEFINGPWAAQQRREDFDAVDASTRYRRIAEKTRTWGIRAITLQCLVAHAIILDEYQCDRDGALAVLEEAVAALGEHPIVGRALARIHWRDGEYRKAFEIFLRVAAHFSDVNPVERVFSLRQAAISAAKCGEWSQSEKWFLDAQVAVNRLQGGHLDVMAIGLGADSGVAAIENGDEGRALTRFSEAVGALAGVDHEGSLRGAWCHRAVRQAVVWARSRIERRGGKFGGSPIGMEAGFCSNPDPSGEIREIPLGHLDVAWYMLAMAETAASVDVGITATLDDRLERGSIPQLEAVLRLQMIQMDIGRLDAAGFADDFITYLESTVYLSKEDDRVRETLDLFEPKRGQIPPLGEKLLGDPVAEQGADEAIIAYGIRSAIAERPAAMTDLEAAMDSRLTVPYPGKRVFDNWNERGVSLRTWDQIVVTVIKAVLRNDAPQPDDFWVVGLRLFEWINQSRFASLLTARLASWLRSGWKRISTTQAFLLSRPRQTVPGIEERSDDTGR